MSETEEFIFSFVGCWSIVGRNKNTVEKLKKNEKANNRLSYRVAAIK